MSAPNPADPTKAIAAYLQANVGDMLAKVPPGIKGMQPGVPAVFRPQVPPEFDQVMPTRCIAIRRAGGYKRFGRGQMPLADPNLDILCYGAVRLGADDVAAAVVIALRQLVEEIWEDTLLYSADIAGGPLPLPDQQTLWPTTLVTAQVLHAEQKTS